jgi:hypothetical protein
LLKPRDLIPEGIGFAQRKKFGEKCSLTHSLDSECAADLQELLKMNVTILRGRCTMLMRAGLSLKLPSLMFVSRPVLMLALDGAEKSLMHLRAAISAGLCGGDDP